jgi:ABC-type amino acid transport substrate-binding protein
MKSAGLQRLFKNRRAVSAVISNLILMGAAIAVGFSVLAWSMGQATSYNNQYSQTIAADINQTKERVTFEYVLYNNTNSNLRVYLLNSGTIDGIAPRTVYVFNTTWTYTASIALTFFNGTNPTNQQIDVGQERSFTLSSITLVSGKRYSLQIMTARGSSFVQSFYA